MQTEGQGIVLLRLGSEDEISGYRQAVTRFCSAMGSCDEFTPISCLLLDTMEAGEAKRLAGETTCARFHRLLTTGFADQALQNFCRSRHFLSGCHDMEELVQVGRHEPLLEFLPKVIVLRLLGLPGPAGSDFEP